MTTTFASWPTPLALKIHRVAKFKQRRQILSRPHLATLPHIAAGGCTGLCACWIERRLQNPAEPAIARLASLNTDASWTRIDDLSRRFNQGTDRSDRAHGIMPNVPGKYRVAAIYIDGEGDFKDLAKKLDEWPGYYVIELSFKAGDINHLCALYNDGTRVHFFDPNSGEYVLPQALVTGFFRKLRTHYANYVSPGGGREARKEFERLWMIPIGV